MQLCNQSALRLQMFFYYFKILHNYIMYILTHSVQMYTYAVKNTWINQLSFSETKSNLQWHDCEGCLAQPYQQRSDLLTWLWLAVIVTSLFFFSPPPYRISAASWVFLVRIVCIQLLCLHTSIWLINPFLTVTWFMSLFFVSISCPAQLYLRFW